jgi:regulator of sirC expression with transglutaminase-like and TPR domain
MSLSGRLMPLTKRRKRTIIQRLRRNLRNSHGRSKRWLGISIVYN